MGSVTIVVAAFAVLSSGEMPIRSACASRFRRDPTVAQYRQI